MLRRPGGHVGGRRAARPAPALRGRRLLAPGIGGAVPLAALEVRRQGLRPQLCHDQLPPAVVTVAGGAFGGWMGWGGVGWDGMGWDGSEGRNEMMKVKRKN